MPGEPTSTIDNSYLPILCSWVLNNQDIVGVDGLAKREIEFNYLYPKRPIVG